MKRKIILYIAISLDGFIAKPNGDIGWLTKYESSEEDYGFNKLYNQVGTVFVGGTTFRQIKDTYYGKDVFVFTKKSQPIGEINNTHFVRGDVKKIVNSLKLGKNKVVWLAGGGSLVGQFLTADLIDEYILTVIPALLGQGIPLFQGENMKRNLRLLEVKSYKSGLVQLHYTKPS